MAGREPNSRLVHDRAADQFCLARQPGVLLAAEAAGQRPARVIHRPMNRGIQALVRAFDNDIGLRP